MAFPRCVWVCTGDVSRFPGSPAPKKTYDKPKKSQPPVWTGTPKNEPENMSFEDMLARFKTKSDERMSDLKKNTAAKRGSSTPRRGGGNQRGF